MTFWPPSDLPFQAFMAHLPAKDNEEILEKLQEYDIGSYLIGYETDPYEHTHFLVQMTTTTYHNFANTVFKKKYNLRGQARHGLPRQYGKLKKIEDLEKMASYTIKSGNIKSNMPQDEVNKYFEKSFKKQEKQKMHLQVFEAIEQKSHYPFQEYMNEYEYSKCKSMLQQKKDYTISSDNNGYKIIINIKQYIINYLRINTDINMCRSNVNSYAQYFIKHTKHYEDAHKDKLIFNLIFN